MQFKQRAGVITAQGQNAGRIERVVIDPRTKEVTHVVVRKGTLFTGDKVVPIELIASATEGGIVLRDNAGDLQALPDFEDEQYVQAQIDAAAVLHSMGYLPAFYWYPPFEPGRMGNLSDQPQATLITETERNIPEGAVAMKEGAKVISADDKHVGDVEQVLTDPQADRATHFLISKGVLLKEKKIVPVRWVNDINENEVHLAVGSSLLDELRAYRG